MRDRRCAGAFVLLLISFTPRLSAQEPVTWHDPSPHTVQFVTVEDNVKLEVLDWGGSGRPLVLLAGLGNTAHVFDEFAPKLTSRYHVYGITRRGYGASSEPASGYSADRLGDDVFAVLDTLKLDYPILVGHSITGEELSSIGSRHPERIAGLVYLDAGYPYAYYDQARGDFYLDVQDLQKKLHQLQSERSPATQKRLVRELLQTDLPGIERVLQDFQMDLQVELPRPPAATDADRASFPALGNWLKSVRGFAVPEAELRQQSTGLRPDGSVGDARDKSTIASAIVAGGQKYTDIRVPVLAIFAIPHDPGPFSTSSSNRAALAAAEAHDTSFTEAQAKAFETGVPSARVVRLPHANHYLFITNEADVLREIRVFLAGLHS
jgi:non-heme chloroperoxidase